MKSQKLRAQEKREKKKKDKERMWEVFEEIWKERPHYSELSWTWLGREISSNFFHHILPKHNNEEAMFDKDNIILLTWEEHSMVEANPSKYEEINKRREKLKEKYG